jgi:hypothetical protein
LGCARLVRPPFEQFQFQADGAANATPVEGEMDWAVPQTRPAHTAKVSHNLLETTKSIRRANRPSRSLHTHSKFLRISRSRIRCILWSSSSNATKGFHGSPGSLPQFRHDRFGAEHSVLVHIIEFNSQTDPSYAARTPTAFQVQEVLSLSGNSLEVTRRVRLEL